jgi:hypothetical protein
MPIVDIESLKTSQYISFTTLEPYDEITYYGIIEAIGGYSMVTKYGKSIINRY